MTALPPRLSLTVIAEDGKTDVYEDVHIVDVDCLELIVLYGKGSNSLKARHDPRLLRSIEVRFEAQAEEKTA